LPATKPKNHILEALHISDRALLPQLYQSLGSTAGGLTVQLGFELADLRKAPHSPSKGYAALTRSSRLSERSTAPRPSNGLPSARNGSSHLSTSSESGCAPNAHGCHATPTLPRRSITCSTAGRSSHAFSTRAASACQTTPPSALCAASLSGAIWLFAGSDRGGERAAAICTLIATAKLNGVDPQAWLANVLRRIADHPASQLHQLLPRHWKHRQSPPLTPDHYPSWPWPDGYDASL
jgi:IS66 C-terminal element